MYIYDKIPANSSSNDVSHKISRENKKKIMSNNIFPQIVPPMR